MARAQWDVSGNRLYELGVDRGMLYVDDNVAVPWNGLASVTESPSGADPQPYYIDGQKYLLVSASEDFAATIEAFYSPEEFAACLGAVQLSPGLYVTGQSRKSFGFSYRTLIGNDVSGTSYGYKIHLVYGASPKSSAFSHATITASPSLKTYSWSLVTTPPIVQGYKPTSHFVIDTRFNDSSIVTAVENVIYGSDSADPSLPTAQELIALITSS